MPIIDRFEGEAGVSALSDALIQQRIFSGDKALVDDVIKVARLKQFHSNEELIEEAATDNSILFILSGSVSIVRSGRTGPIRRAGEYVGELTLLDPSTVRSATVSALEETVVAQVSEPQFKKLCIDRPELWRALAIDVAARLRQRLDDVAEKTLEVRFLSGPLAKLWKSRKHCNRTWIIWMQISKFGRKVYFNLLARRLKTWLRRQIEATSRSLF